MNFGDEIEVAKDEISDWIYAEDQEMVGGFTVRVLCQGTLEQQANDTTEQIGDHELIGKWEVISIDGGGGPDAIQGFHLDVTDATITIVSSSGAERSMGQIRRIDPATTPKQIDLRNGSEICLGIYELHGDSLKLIVRDPGSERPREFKGARDGMLFTLKRD